MVSCFSLNAFESHSLADQSSSALMDRVDTKYLIDAAELNQCLAELTAEYTVLEMNGCRGMAYDTLYFDTPGRQLYLDHHNGKLNRVKVRTRHYRATGERFLEVKVKTNKLRTSKQRMVLTGAEPDARTLHHFLQEQLGLPATRMLPALFVHYHRITLLSRTGHERVTVDTDICFEHSGEHQRIGLPGVVLVEVKSLRHQRRSPVLDILKRMGHRPVSFSKYCIGTALLCRGRIKANRFKPVLSKLDALRAPREYRYFKESSWNLQLMSISLSA